MVVILITLPIHYFQGRWHVRRLLEGKRRGKEQERITKKRRGQKKRAKEQAAQKERKRIERERVNQEKEKKRKNWKEKFITPADDLISRWKWKWRIFHFWYCKWVCWPDDFTDTTPDVNHQLEKTITEIKSVSPHQALTIAQLRRTLATLQSRWTCSCTYNAITVSTTPNAANFHITSPEVLRINTSQSRPVTRRTTGGKCPRRSLPLQTVVSSDHDVKEVCASCTRLQRRVREPEDQLKSLQSQSIFNILSRYGIL